MTRYLIRRLLQAIPTFLRSTLLTSFIVCSALGDPVLQATFDSSINSATREVHERLDLDWPQIVQCINWLMGNEWQDNPNMPPETACCVVTRVSH